MELDGERKRTRETRKGKEMESILSPRRVNSLGCFVPSNFAARRKKEWESISFTGKKFDGEEEKIQPESCEAKESNASALSFTRITVGVWIKLM